MLEIHAEVEVDGPLFDGRAMPILDDIAEEVADAVADQGFRDIHFTLHRVLKRPTGFYQSQIRDRAFASTHVLYDNRVVYGPWLEGVGSRNSPVTRFEGYFTFRRVALHLNRKAKPIAEQVIARHIGRLQ
ncbi:hypothetical protein [Thermoactinospora rubra]|uniref:hypothetical protein n=1 Tax=Thermoactinospora rubra TaxID=1088767 RepID=UPI000A10C46D|nr:hypothetical protein [Thermoactinospora rubra]